MASCNDDILLDEIALSLNRATGHKTNAHLIGVFGNARSVFSATHAELVEEAGLRPDVASSLVSRSTHAGAEAELRYCRDNGITPVGYSSALYPPLLRECCDYPMVLYAVGNVDALSGDMLAVVGTRKISPYGSVVCEKLIGGLANEGGAVTIVSGLAYGVDAAAHRAALSAGLPTVAVLGNRLPRIYPADNTGLARKIVEKGGCIVSELSSGSFEGKMNFVARNRIIAGMSRGTLIVESPLKGGSMITAEMAAGYERTVMAVPGRVTDDNSAGANHLIRKLKAVAVNTPRDVAEELGLDAGPSAGRTGAGKHAHADGLSEGESFILGLVAGDDAATVDSLVERTGISASQMLALLFDLELKGLVRKTPGGTYLKI